MINEPGFDDTMQAAHDKIQWIMAPTAAEMIDDRMSVFVNWASNERHRGPACAALAIMLETNLRALEALHAQCRISSATS